VLLRSGVKKIYLDQLLRIFCGSVPSTPPNQEAQAVFCLGFFVAGLIFDVFFFSINVDCSNPVAVSYKVSRLTGCQP